jgi:hypothetical protein
MIITALAAVLAGLEGQELMAPLNDCPKKAVVVGELPDDLKSVLSRLTAKKSEADHLEIDAKYARTDEAREEILAKRAAVLAEADLLKTILTYGIEAEFNLFTKEMAGVDKNWQVFYLPRPTKADVFGLLDQFFGVKTGLGGEDEEDEGDRTGEPPADVAGPTGEPEGGPKAEEIGVPTGEAEATVPEGDGAPPSTGE